MPQPRMNRGTSPRISEYRMNRGCGECHRAYRKALARCRQPDETLCPHCDVLAMSWSPAFGRLGHSLAMCLALYARVTRCPSFRDRHIGPLIFNGSIGRSARYKRVVLTLVSTFDSHASSVSELLVGPTGLCLEPTALQQHPS